MDEIASQHGDQRESPSQPLVNVSQDMCLIVTSANPQACPALPPFKFIPDVISSDEYSQAPPSGAQLAFSHQPSPELLMSLGIKVRDFAYENTLPAIVPVPRVPRQVQPAPRALKRSQRDWDDKEGPMIDSSPAQPLSGETAIKKPRSLERKPTEPLQEPAVQHTRTLERITIRRVCSIVIPPPRRALPISPHPRFSAGPPTSPLTPPLSHIASRDSELVQTPPAFPFVVHVDDTSMIPTSRIDTESQTVSFRPALYTKFALGSRSSLRYSPAPSPQNASPAPLTSPLPSPNKELEADPRVRKRRSRGIASTTPAPNRYQLRQRPIPSSRASSLSRSPLQPNSTSKSLPRRARRMR